MIEVLIECIIFSKLVFKIPHNIKHTFPIQTSKYVYILNSNSIWRQTRFHKPLARVTEQSLAL
jgi:hypothetical protein